MPEAPGGLAGQVALVTGAGQGIGRATALALASPASGYVTGQAVTVDGGFLMY